MKLIGKGLMLSVLFVLLLISVKAELDPVFYDANLLNNYPYGDHHYLYESGDVGTASRGNQKIGSMWNEDVNAYEWNVNTLVAFCRGGGNDCPSNSGLYEAWVEFYGFVPATTNFKIYYFLDDFMRWNIDSAEHNYPLVNNYVYDTKELSPGWHYFKIYYFDTGGNADHLVFQTTDGSTGNAPLAPYYKFFTALVSPDQYSNINQKIHLNEGSVAGDCSDFIDNDGDWNSDGTLSNDGVPAFNFNAAIYGIDPPQGRGYKILNDDYPQFGEVNVDCFDQGCEGQDGPYDMNGNQSKCNYQTEKIQYCNDGYDNDFDGFTDIDDTDCSNFCSGDLNLDVLTALGSDYDPAAVDGRDACCGDDSGGSSQDVTLFDEPFNDNSNGWQPGPNAQPVIISNGHLILPSSTMIAKKIIPLNPTDKKIVFIVNDSSLYSPSNFRIEFLDNSGTGIFVNNNEVSLEGCTRLGLSGDPNRLYGVMMPSSASGIERTCAITVRSSIITDLLLILSTDGVDSRIDYVKVIERPHSGDLGYVTPDNKWLCYNNLSQFVNPENEWNWIYAPESQFLITPVNYSGKTVDYISNSENWYYCDANHLPGLTGLPIPEYNTFPNPEFGGLEMTCSGFATYLTSLITQYPYEDCATAQGPNCCVDGGSFNVLENPEMLGECYCRTASVTGSEELFCSIEENKILSICSDYSFTEDKILTEFCNQNPRNCVTLDHYDTTLACDAQPFNSGHDCSVTQVCSNGVILPVLNGEPCCVGVSASCIEKSQITNQQICEESGGRPYTPSNTTYCLPKNQSIQMSVEEGACCFGAILHTDNFPFSSFENLNNNTFSCFAYQGNNLFGQCCYDNCNTMTQFSPIYVDATRNRAFSIKLPFNIQTSYDLYNSSAGILQDYSHTTTTPDFTFYQVAYFNGKKNTSMAYYDNLEFDIIYNQEANVQKIYINDVDYGPVTTYVNNGNKRGISHHVKIPLRLESKMQDLGQIKVVTNPTSVKVLYDNIYFSINSDTPESSLNYYCTGGFAAWIKDLDSEITDPNDAFFTSENSYIDGYGRYAVACDAYLPYGWTGHYCCGDDTNQTNYGEYYEDLLNPTWPTTGGCFRGSTVIDGETVWKIKGYIEDHTDMFTSDDELKSYYYSDLIYTDDSFVGCQIPASKYADLKVSYDGLTQTATNLINDVISDSCTVVGTYYCMNGIWRQHVSGLNQEYSELNNIYLPSIPSSLELKSVPPATELIKNGDFGGECPPGICDGTVINTGQ